MKNLFHFFAKDPDRVRIQKSESGGTWTVKKGFNILYIGTKEKCQIYMNQMNLA
ncbi:MAG: hypothetical protein ABJG78_12945 [Cyclobacteriaceae bacterium]